MKKIFKLLILVIVCFVSSFVFAAEDYSPKTCKYKFKIGDNAAALCDFEFSLTWRQHPRDKKKYYEEYTKVFKCYGTDIATTEERDKYIFKYNGLNYYVRPFTEITNDLFWGDNFQQNNVIFNDNGDCNPIYYKVNFSGSSIKIGLYKDKQYNGKPIDKRLVTIPDADIGIKKEEEPSDEINCGNYDVYDKNGLKVDKFSNLKATVYGGSVFTFSFNANKSYYFVHGNALNGKCPDYIVNSCDDYSAGSSCFKPVYKYEDIDYSNLKYLFTKSGSKTTRSCGNYITYKKNGESSDEYKNVHVKIVNGEAVVTYDMKKPISGFISGLTATIYASGWGKILTECPSKFYVSSTGSLGVDFYTYGNTFDYYFLPKSMAPTPSEDNDKPNDNKPSYNPYDDIVKCDGANAINSIPSCWCMPAAVADITSFIYGFLRIGGPVLLIILGGIDLGKAIVATDESGIKKAKKKLINKFVAAACIFLVLSVIQMIVNITGGGKYGNLDSNNKNCLYYLLYGYES